METLAHVASDACFSSNIRAKGRFLEKSYWRGLRCLAQDDGNN